MIVIEKLGTQIVRVLVILLGITASIGLMNYCAHNIVEIIANNPSIIARAAIVMYILFGLSAFIYSISAMIMHIEDNFKSAKKMFGYVFLLNLCINLLIPSFFPQNYFKELINYLPFLLANVGVLFSLSTIFLSIKGFLNFNNWYEKTKKQFTLYFKNRKLAKEKNKKLIQEAKLKAKEKQVQMQTQSVANSHMINLSVFDTIMAIVPNENNEQFNAKLMSLKNTMNHILEKPQDIEVYNEVKILVEQNLPKMTQLYLQSQNQMDKENALEVLEKMDSYFKLALNQLVNQQNFKTHLNKESELKYFNEKYSASR